jgi:hypothetical protein
VPEPAEGPFEVVERDAGRGQAPVARFEGSDDRVIVTDPVNNYGQYHFILAQCLTARQVSSEAYAARCIEAVEACHADQPTASEGSYNVPEYGRPMVACT